MSAVEISIYPSSCNALLVIKINVRHFVAGMWRVSRSQTIVLEIGLHLA